MTVYEMFAPLVSYKLIDVSEMLSVCVMRSTSARVFILYDFKLEISGLLRRSYINHGWIELHDHCDFAVDTHRHAQTPNVQSDTHSAFRKITQ